MTNPDTGASVKGDSVGDAADAGSAMSPGPGDVGGRGRPRAGWATLGRRAKAFRVVHAAWSVVGLATLGYIWACVVTRRRDRLLRASVGFLVVEGAGLVVGGGDCPMGPLQAQWGDSVPFFELLLPPRAAKAAVPILAAAAVAGLLALVLRRPAGPSPTSPRNGRRRPSSLDRDRSFHR